MTGATGILAALLVAASPGALPGQQPAYPPTPRDTIVDHYGSLAVPAPYQWLEDLASPRTAAWVETENALAFAYLSHLPRREAIVGLLTRLWDYRRTQVPVREAGKLFFRENSGLQKQAVVDRQADLTSSPETILDPNAISPDGSTAVASWSVSPDGRFLAYTAASGGSDLQDIHLRDLSTGAELVEVVRRVKFSGMSWTHDSQGFLYERFRGSADSANLQDANRYHQVWYHPVGGRADRMLFDRPANPDEYVGASVSDDGRWLFLWAGSGTSNNRLWIADLGDPRRPNLTAPPVVVAAEEDAIYSPLGAVGRTLYLYTTWKAPKGRIVAVPIGASDRTDWSTVVAEGPDVIDEWALVGNRLVLSYLVDVRSRLRLFDLTGAPQGEVRLPEPGTLTSLSGRNTDRDFFFGFTSYLRPTTIFRYDLAAGALTPFRAVASSFNATKYETRATFYESKDGTRIPIFITARKDLALDGTHPTLLYGYGGFDISLTPFYSPAVAAWLELGGVYALANLRGGGEYGEEWHHAGMREKKQNVFDDFIGAAEFLIHGGYTVPDRLAIQGGSNGGLLVGAVMTQRPELFGVALPAVGVMDMLRFQRFTGGKFWTEEYGSSDDSTAARYLRAYSPLHNLKPGTCYPATLITTADHDDRVVPSHSFKFTAALQAAQGCGRPILIRVEKLGSHGYRPTDRIIAEIADEYAFALANLELGSP